MPVTVKVNGTANSLVNKGSNAISTATIPDVCKTPSPAGPVPIPYPNISQSVTLAKGTTTVKADGMMIAIKGSEFSLSNGDNAGVAGGVKSSTFMKESTWILYSFDVKIDGKNACRLTDKKFQNHENTVNLAGALLKSVAVDAGLTDKEKEVADCLCAAFCKKVDQHFTKGPRGGYTKKGTIKRGKKKKDNLSKDLEDDCAGRTPGVKPPACLKGHNVSFTEHFQKTKKTIPDANLRRGRLPTSPVTRCYDFKFPGDRPRGSQKMRQTKLAGGNKVVILDPTNCGC
jgi:uncharacterized Zn-binding protein involved in type VI secretion